MMRSFLVRHAKAGNRERWEGDDRDRPLSTNGWAQSEAVAKRLAKLGPTALVSSPYLRCRQTLEPLSKRTGLSVVEDERLAEGGRFEDALDLLAELGDGAVLCSHGDLIPDTITALERRGCRIDTHPDWRKATIWTLEGDGERWQRATVAPPPD